jgi:hypothetical protein
MNNELALYVLVHIIILLVAVMAQGLDTRLSPIPPGFDSLLNHQVFFKSLPPFGGDVKLSFPATYLVVVVKSC